MPKLQIEKSITINVTPDKVYQVVSDFNQWRAWSPWLIMEPEAKVTIAPDAKYYEWVGSRVGEGNMRIVNEKENESVDYDLAFLKPWKSKSKVNFSVQQEGTGTKVTWSMDGSLPFFLFFLKKMMTIFVGMDYERGLKMLKDYVEEGEVHSKLSFDGTSVFAQTKFVGIRRETTIGQMGDIMSKDLKTLGEFMNDKQDQVNGVPMSIYHKMNFIKDKVIFTSAIPVSSDIDGLPADAFMGDYPETKVYTVTHTGTYDHLGNPWSTLVSMQRNKEFKKGAKGGHPFETYHNHPGETPDKELITKVNMPVG